MDQVIHKQPVAGPRTNDEQAFEEMYRQYFVRLFRFCFSIVHQKEVAEEIVSDVFLNLWKRKSSLSEIDNLQVYLYVATKNLSLNHLRNNHFVHLEDISDQMSQHLQIGGDPESLLISAETMRLLHDVINRLPPRCKLIFKLIKEDGLKYKEVALLLDVSVKTVEAQLAIATKKIALALTKGN